ncbi:hypothetical protein Aduo_008101 [Ancylostoma duodenale]
MRLTLLALILVVSVNAGIFGGILNNTKILKIKEKMRKLENKIKKTLELTPQAILSLKERLSKLRPIKQTHVKDTGDSIDEINEESEVGELLFQGDMVLTEKQAEEVKEDVEEEIAEAHNPSSEVFSRKAHMHGRKIRALISERIGQQRTKYAYSLRVAVGRIHDRDNYITINSQNVKADWLDQFTKQTPQTNENYGITYDYGSIMHYGGRSASFNKKPTMVPFDTMHQETLGSPFISFYDLVLNAHYNCTEKCKGDPRAAKCYMGGVPHPRDCSKCLCPGGYGGKLCNERPSGCGDVLQATKEYSDLSKTIGNPNMQEREDFEICNYWIESPANTQIEVRIDTLNGNFAVDGCAYFGVEIKTQKDQKATGYRFCAYEDADVTLLSSSNRVPIMIYSREGQTDVKLQYRYVTDGRPGPKPIRTTKRPGVLPEGFRCADKSTCQLLRKDYCNVLDEDLRMSMRPKMCGYC